MDTLEIKQKFAAGGVSRREALTAMGAMGLGVAMMPVLGRRAGAAEEHATYFTWGGYDDPGLFPSYIAKHGGNPNFPTFGEAEEALTKLRSGYVVDVVHPCNSDVPRWIASGLFQPIDTSKLSNWGDVVGSLKTLAGAQSGDKQWFVPFEWGQTSITYRTDLVDLQGKEESWELLWDERYKGKLAVIDSVGDAWWCTAILAGVDFNNVTDDDVKKVNDLMRQQRPLLRMYTNDMTSLEQALASGEVVAAMTWNESPVNLKGQGVPVKFANPKEGALTWACGLVLHRDAPQRDKAHDLIDAMLSPEAGAYVINEYGYGHSNTKSFNLVKEERLAELSLTRNPSDILDNGTFQVPQKQELETRLNRDFEDIKAGF